jgi:tRNA-splicing endonuclease subunit Sen34
MAVPVSLPVPISQVAGRYFLYDPDSVSFLRKEYNISGVLVGTLPQAPSQNVFSGLPLELLPEEARILVEENVGYVVDDISAHRNGLRNLTTVERGKVVEAFRKEGSEAARAAQYQAMQRKETALKRRGISLSTQSGSSNLGESILDDDETLFASPSNSFPTPPSRSPTPQASVPASESALVPFGITPTTSQQILPNTVPPLQSVSPPVPASYPLFRYLHSKGYFLSPGLRFGAQYMAYPGDPLRFHSHFLVVGRNWDEEWDLGELIGGGRLGTGVKKGFLLGGEVPHEIEAPEVSTKGQANHSNVRAFCIEWSGM